MLETYHCKACDTIKPLADFPKHRGQSTKLLRRQYRDYCKPCLAEKGRNWRKQYRETHGKGYKGSGNINSLPVAERPWMSAVRTRLGQAKSRCLKFKRDVPKLSDEYLYQLLLKQDRKCALTGAPLRLEVGHPLCLSLDQIEPEKGYVEGNVQWLAWCVNRAKGDLATQDFFSMCNAVLKHQKVQRLSP